MKISRIIWLILATLFVSGSAAAAAAEPREDLKERFKSRMHEIRQLKSDGIIGETDQGYVDVVKEADQSARKIVDSENADRRELYQLIGEKEGVAPETVAQRNALRNFERAGKGEFLKKDGEWSQKS